MGHRAAQPTVAAELGLQHLGSFCPLHLDPTSWGRTWGWAQLLREPTGGPGALSPELSSLHIRQNLGRVSPRRVGRRSSPTLRPVLWLRQEAPAESLSCPLSRSGLRETRRLVHLPVPTSPGGPRRVHALLAPGPCVGVPLLSHSSTLPSWGTPGGQRARQGGDGKGAELALLHLQSLCGQVWHPN